MLRGLCWGHERLASPMRAASAAWRERTGVEIVWDAFDHPDLGEHRDAEVRA